MKIYLIKILSCIFADLSKIKGGWGPCKSCKIRCSWFMVGVIKNANLTPNAYLLNE